MNHRQGCLPTAVRWLAISLCVLVVVTLPPTLLARAVTGRVFSPDLVKQELSDRLINSGALRSAALRAVVPERDVNPVGLAALTANLDEEDWQQISRTVVPDGWVQTQLDTIVDAVFEWLANDHLMPTIQLDVEPIKRNLIGAGTESITRIVVESWPNCSLHQLAELELTFRQSGQIPLILCAPPEPIKSVAIGFVAGAFREGARLLPTTLNLSQAVQPAGADDLLQIKRTLRSIRLGAGWAIALPLILLGLVMAMVIRSWRALLRWWGFPLFASGLLTSGLAIALTVFVARWQAMDIAGAGASPILLGAVLNALRDLIQRGLLRGAVLGGVFAAVSGAALVASRSMPAVAPRAAPTSPQPAKPSDQPPSGMFG